MVNTRHAIFVIFTLILFTCFISGCFAEPIENREQTVITTQEDETETTETTTQNETSTEVATTETTTTQPTTVENTTLPTTTEATTTTQTALTKPSTTKPSTTSPDISQTVYITETGAKYHNEGCRFLHDSKIPISLSKAKEMGYTPCSVCNAPE